MVDSIILYDAGETQFTTNGLGGLRDAISCIVTEERNGEFELEMEYPVTGLHYRDIELRKIIYCRTNPNDDNREPFRIYEISKPINGVVTINAAHISYDLSGYALSPFSSPNLPDAISKINGSARIVETPFTVEVLDSSGNPRTTDTEFKIERPCSIRSILGGTEGSLLDTYRGEYKFSKFTCSLLTQRGKTYPKDNFQGVYILYGKNMTDVEQTENISEVYTHLYPYYYSTYSDGFYTYKNGIFVEIPDKLITLQPNATYTKILSLDLTSKFQTNDDNFYTKVPSPAELKVAAEKYISDNDLTNAKLNLKVSFEQLSQTTEYAFLKDLEAVNLCDQVCVEFLELGIRSISKVIKTSYDVITGRYKSIELGDPSSSLSSTIAGNTTTIASNAVATNDSIYSISSEITGNYGGYAILHSSDGETLKPNELLILDSESEGDISKTNSIWRFNSQGLGFAVKQEGKPNAYVSDYMYGIDHLGRINASMISTGALDARYIQSGSITAEQLSTEYKDDVNSTIVQMGENITATFSKTYVGGANLLKNSSGLNSINGWSLEGDDGEAQSIVGEGEGINFNADTISGAGFKINSYGQNEFELRQSVDVAVGETYTVTIKALMPVDGECYAVVYDPSNTNEHYLFSNNEAVLEDGNPVWFQASCTFKATTNLITFAAGAISSYFYIADIMLVNGDHVTTWTSAPNEIYTTQVKIDGDGISVLNSESSTRTNINNHEFAIYSGDTKVLHVDKDNTLLHRTKIAKDLTIQDSDNDFGTARFVPVEGGVDVVVY